MFAKISFVLSLLIGSGMTGAQGTGSIRIRDVIAVYIPAGQGEPMLLKINSWYLLSSYPIAPYQDARGSVMVPLRTVGKLLGGEVRLNLTQRSGTLTTKPYGIKPSHKLRFSANSTSIEVDGRKMNIISAPRWMPRHKELIVPLTPLLLVARVKVVKKSTNLIHLRSEIVKRTSGFGNPPEQWFPTGYRSTEQLIPKNVSVRRAIDFYGKPFFDIALTLEQVSGSPIPQGMQGLFTYVAYRGGKEDVGRRDSTLELRFGSQNKDPCTRNNEGFRCRTYFFSGLLIDYITAQVTLKT